MFLNSWSLALTLCSVVVIFLALVAARTAIRVLRYWDPASDSNRQISLEGEIWLSSTLVNYGLAFQIVSLVLFVMAADQFCEAIIGAMCATGALLANGFGVPALIVKLVGVFLYGFWILLHQVDIQSESYPLVRIKYIYLLVLIPLLALDFSLQTLYIAGLKPDIITSCCAVVFSGSTGGGSNLTGAWPQDLLLGVVFALMTIIAVGGGVLLGSWHRGVAVLFSAAWFVFLGLALVTVTTVISSYVYAMPFHKCPFCLLKPEYGYYGFALYGSLLPASFFGMSVALIGFAENRPGLGRVVDAYRRFAVRSALILLAVFTLLSSYHYLRYMISGGEF